MFINVLFWLIVLIAGIILVVVICLTLQRLTRPSPPSALQQIREKRRARIEPIRFRKSLQYNTRIPRARAETREFPR